MGYYQSWLYGEGRRLHLLFDADHPVFETKCNPKCDGLPIRPLFRFWPGEDAFGRVDRPERAHQLYELHRKHMPWECVVIDAVDRYLHPDVPDCE